MQWCSDDRSADSHLPSGDFNRMARSSLAMTFNLINGVAADMLRLPYPRVRELQHCTLIGGTS
jgi:hypothetical protein